MDGSGRLVVAITGASGSIYGIRLLELLHERGEVETHLVISPAGRRTLVHETDYSAADVEELADVGLRLPRHRRAAGERLVRHAGHGRLPVLDPHAVGACQLDVGQPHHAGRGRHAEGRPSACRRAAETPLHLGHLRLAAQLSEIGGVVMPPVPRLLHAATDRCRHRGRHGRARSPTARSPAPGPRRGVAGRHHARRFVGGYATAAQSP